MLASAGRCRSRLSKTQIRLLRESRQLQSTQGWIVTTLPSSACQPDKNLEEKYNPDNESEKNADVAVKPPCTSRSLAEFALSEVASELAANYDICLAASGAAVCAALSAARNAVMPTELTAVYPAQPNNAVDERVGQPHNNF